MSIYKMGCAAALISACVPLPKPIQVFEEEEAVSINRPEYIIALAQEGYQVPREKFEGPLKELPADCHIYLSGIEQTTFHLQKCPDHEELKLSSREEEFKLHFRTGSAEGRLEIRPSEIRTNGTYKFTNGSSYINQEAARRIEEVVSKLEEMAKEEVEKLKELAKEKIER